MPDEAMELLPRIGLLGPLLRGARVLEIGGGAQGICAPGLVERGAASVVALGAADTAPAPGIEHRSVPIAELPVRAFDLVLVHDPAALQDGDVAALADRLTPRGHLLVANRAAGISLARTATPAGAYARILDALRAHFPSIQVVTQQALLGWVLSPVGVQRPPLAVETSFAPPEAPAFHLFVCGKVPLPLSAQVLVPWPATEALAAGGEPRRGRRRVKWKVRRAAPQAHRVRIEALLDELRHARERVAERESWIEGLRHEVETRHRDGEEQAAELAAARARLVRLERENEEGAEALRRVREQLVARARELEGARRAVDARTEVLRLVEEETDRLRTTLQAAHGALAEEQGRRAEVEAERDALAKRLEELEAAQAALPPGVAEVAREQASLEAELEVLRHASPALDGPAPAAEATDLPRRLRALEERAEAAERRAQEAEERLLAAERRLDQAEAARTESVAAARRWQLEAEAARREAAGVAAGMADREALRKERDEAIARAAEEAGRRAAARAQLQEQIARANTAEEALHALRTELERVQRDRPNQRADEA